MLPMVDTNGHVSGAPATPGAGVGYRYRAADAGEDSAPLPPRLLLSHGRASGDKRFTRAFNSACIQGTISLIPLIFCTAFLAELTGWKQLCLFILVAGLLGVMVRTYWNDLREPGQAWERTEWLDFETRTWHLRKVYTDHSLPDEIEQLPMESLSMVCFLDMRVEGESYNVGLCTLEELKRKDSDPNCLHRLYMADLQPNAHAVAGALARRWGLVYWQYLQGSRPLKKRMH